MANSERGEVQIVLDKPRILKYNLNSWALIEDKLGLRPETLPSREMKFSEIRFLLYAGLVHEDKSLTEMQVGEMVDLKNIDILIDQIASSFELTFEVVESDPNAKREPKKSAGTGKNSKK